MEDDIVTLTRGLVRCDEDAWRDLHRRYFTRLRSQAMARGVPEGDAADVVQRVYLRVIRHAKVFESEESLLAWLACLTRCEAIDTTRRSRRRSWLGERFQQWQEFSRPGEAADGGALDSALSTLEEGDRRLVSRHYVEGWSQEELAADQKTSIKAIESRLARLRRRLRKQLETETPLES
jgi:RNA polymerase sigma-70 factor (ECF subfamily)